MKIRNIERLVKAYSDLVDAIVQSSNANTRSGVYIPITEGSKAMEDIARKIADETKRIHITMTEGAPVALSAIGTGGTGVQGGPTP